MPEIKKSKISASEIKVEKDGITAIFLGKDSENNRYIRVRVVDTGQYKFWPAGKVKFQ